jgi:hypothetical protein
MYSVFALTIAAFGLWCLAFAGQRALGALALVFAAVQTYGAWFAGRVARALEMARAGQTPSLWRTRPSRVRLVGIHLGILALYAALYVTMALVTGARFAAIALGTGLLFSAGLMRVLVVRTRRRKQRQA